MGLKDVKADDIPSEEEGDEQITTDGGHDETIWATSEGYTPLMDFQSTSAMLSFGPSSADASGGMFFADMTAFGNVVDSDEEEEGVEENESTDAYSSDDVDFRAIADQALFALENEYRMTLGGAAATAAVISSESNTANFESDLPHIRLATEDFGTDFFVANFDDGALESPPAPENRDLPDIDMDAVKRAVQAIHLRNPTLDSSLAGWEARQRGLLLMTPRLHSIIPSAPLSAFRKNTARAVAATANLSRSACIAEALKRLDLLQSQEYFQIDVIGCDHVECASEQRIRQLFEPIVRWIGAYAEAPKHLQISLIGPNVVVPSSSSLPLNFATADIGRMQSAKLACFQSLYEDHYNSVSQPPDVAVAFHAGIWGYREWRTMLTFLAIQKRGIPLVVTAYTIQEAEDDADMIEEVLAEAWGTTGGDGDKASTAVVKAACIWEAEMNAFASKQERETATGVPGRQYRENAAWACWRV